jgi:phosphotransferase system enzyme I (PtsI)
MFAKRKVIQGVLISKGIALGYARIMLPGTIEVAPKAIPVPRLQAELSALDGAVEQTIAEVRALRDSAGKKIGGPVAKIFDAQLLIASDYEFLKQVKDDILKQRRNAGYVYQTHIQQTTAPLKSSSDPYMRRMAVDIEAVAEKVLSHLSGCEASDLKLAPSTILIGRSFTPNDVVAYRRRNAIGFLVSEGGEDSHMALIARSLMVPVVLAEDAWHKIPNNCRIILDGTSGKVIIHPTDKDWDEYQKRKKRLGLTLITRIKNLQQIPPVTKDGKQVSIAANLTLPGPADDILAEQKIPIGLYRTEFLYLSQNKFPDEQTQFEYYSQVAEKFAHTYVIVRIFDLGYDKSLTDRSWPMETNPALGWRGIRSMLDMSHLFKTQVAALLRASTRKNLRIMLPMISDLSEVEKAKKLISQVKFRLRKEQIEFDPDIPIGIMIEVPAAAMTADKLAQAVDFMSIGTNDLTQYTLAADRTNRKVSSLYSPYHPSVLQLIAKTVEACKAHHKQVSICGEMAGDILALPLFIGMDVDSLSMNPARIFDLCRAVKKIDSSLVRHLVGSVLASGSAQEVTSKLQKYRMALEQRKL